MLRFLFCGSAILFAFHSFAQSTDDSIPQQQLAPTEVRALRITDNAPFAKTDISGGALQKRNLGQDLPYLLQFTPSALVTSDAGTGIGYTGIRIRGTDGTRINVTLNGIPINDAESGGSFFVDFPDVASSTSSVQIQRGVGASTNGPGAFGATMSVTNLEGSDSAGAQLNVGFGSFNTQRYTLKSGTGLLRGGFHFDVRLSKISSVGYIQRSASDLKALQILGGWNISHSSNLKFMVMTGREKTQQAWNGVSQDSLKINRRFNELGLKSDGSFYSDQTDNYGQDYYQLFFNHQFNNKWSAHLAGFLTRGKGYYQEYRLGDAFSDYGLQPFVSPSGADTVLYTNLIRQLWLDNYFYGNTFSLQYDGGKTKAVLGGAVSRYDGRHYGFVKWAELGVPDDYRWYKLKAFKTDFNVFAKAQHSFGKLLLTGDAQVRNVHYDINGFRKNPLLHPEVSYTFFNPKAGATFLLKNTAVEKQRIYASIALANKEPNRDDFEANTNAFPKPEKLTDVEAGYEMQRTHFTASANFYYMRYTDQLVLTGKINDVGTYTRTNVPNSYRAGIEMVAAAQPLSWLRIGGNATFSKNKIETFTEFVDNYDDGSQQAIVHTNTDLAFSPNQIVSGVFTFSPLRHLPRHQQLELELLGKYAGKQFLDNTSNDARVIGSYAVVDFRLRYSLSFGPFKDAGLQVGINNIFNRFYESNGYTFSYIYGQQSVTSNYYYPQAGRNVLVGLRFGF